MARRKVKLAWIVNDSARKVTFKKRKKGLIKKVEELSILCNVKACVIIYNHCETQPEVWPSLYDVQRVVQNFKSLPETEQCKNMINQEGFLRQRIGKLREQLKRQQKENREAEMVVLMSECLMGKSLYDLCIEDLNDLAWLVESKLKLVQQRIESIQGSNSRLQATSKTTTTTTTTVTTFQETMSVAQEDKIKTSTALEVVAMEIEPLQRQQWFMELMDPYEHMVYGGGEMVMQFGNDNPWLDPCFP